MKFLHRSSLPENPVNFLKVILSDDARSTGVRIPNKFIEKHGTSLLEKVTLKVPNGDVWRVGVQKSRGEIWLTKGWWEFAEHYGLKYGHLLMFKYEGISIFGVIIFNKSASEIVYPPSMKKDKLKNSTKEVATNSSQDVKVTKLTSVKSEEETYSSSEDQNPCFEINGGGKRRALEKAEASFKSDNPFFMSYINKSYVIRKRGLRVPMDFRRKYSRGCKEHSKYLLKLANDRRQKTWEVLDDGIYLGCWDWKMFIKDNGIKVGDICVFERIYEHKNVLAVTIIRYLDLQVNCFLVLFDQNDQDHGIALTRNKS